MCLENFVQLSPKSSTNLFLLSAINIKEKLLNDARWGINKNSSTKLASGARKDLSLTFNFETKTFQHPFTRISYSATSN